MKFFLKNKNILFIFIIYLIVLISMLLILTSNKDAMLRRVGYETFGGCCYNLTIAKWAYTTLADNDKVPQWANHQLARIYFVQGDYITAILYIDKEIALYPDNLNAYYIKGLIYGFMNNNHDAVEVFKYYTSLTRTWAGHNDLAWLQFKIGDYQSALETIDKVINTYPDNVWILNTRAIALYNLHRIAEAKIAIDKAKTELIKMTPERWGASYPGNDPAIYREGLAKMRQSVEDNYKLIYKI